MSITPSLIETPPDEPLPSTITLPEPFGNKLIFPFDTETISLPFTSRSPPSWGVVSAATDVKPPAELIRLSTVILLSVDASASLTNNSSLPDTISPELIDVCPVINVFAVVPVDKIVPDSLGKFSVLSAVGSITLSVVDPTADRTITLPNESGTVLLKSTTENSFITGQTSISSGDIVSGSDELLVSDADASSFKRITVDNLISSAGGLTSVAADSSPQLGAELDVNGNDIVSVSNGNISLLPNGSGKVIIDGNGSSGGVSITDGLIDIRTGTGSVTQVKFYCESSNAHAQTLQAQPHSASSSATLVLPVASGTLIGTGDTGTLPLAAIDIDGGSDIGADLTTSDLIIVDDGAGGTNRKAALSRLTTFMTGQGFVTDDPTALAIALG